MGFKDFIPDLHPLRDLHQNEKTGGLDPLSLALKLNKSVRVDNNSEALETGHLLLTPGNSVQIHSQQTTYYFARAIADPKAKPADQRLFLRRVRRAVHNMRLLDQQWLAVADALERNPPPPGQKPVFPETDPHNFIIDADRQPGISQRVVYEGTHFAQEHRNEVMRILRHAPTKEDILTIGEEIVAKDYIPLIRKKLATVPPVEPYPEDEKSRMGRMRVAAKSLPLDALRLHNGLEIPLVLTDTDAEAGGTANYQTGSFVFDYSSSMPAEYVAAHELCHNLISHDYSQRRVKQSPGVQYAIPSEIAEAAQEFREREAAIRRKDPAMLKQYVATEGNRTSLFNRITELLEYYDKHIHTAAEEARYRDVLKFGWEYELVCDYFAMSRTLFPGESDAMRFISPKMHALCAKLEQDAKKHLASIKGWENYFDNPERNQLFQLIQRDDPLITLPKECLSDRRR